MYTTNKEKTAKTKDALSNFNVVSLALASPEAIDSWSFGEVTKPETINYRTQRSERGGLFDEKIFGPDKDYECYCGKYRGIRYKGIICEKCGVEITRSIVRRERMGHIELATPVSHIWFLRGTPSRLGQVLGMSAADLEKVIYFAGYIVTKVFSAEKERIQKEIENEFKQKVKNVSDDKTKEALKEMAQNAKKEVDSLAEGKVLDEVMFNKFSIKYGAAFEAGIGGEVIYDLLRKVDLKELEQKILASLEKANAVDSDKLNKRLSLVRALIASGQRPEWMFFTKIPVIPPALRPMVPLDGGRFATSDVNDLYRRVINRNNRLLKLKEINAPDVILRNEKRILQEAVDALIDNSIRHGNSLFQGAGAAQKRPLKSLADNLQGKRGLFRSNLLGKRVDYSGRSVIVVGPELHLDECGLPKHMALELFRPFVISELLKKELAFNIRGAGRLIDDGVPEVWAILEDVIKGKYVLLNRAPTLHRLGIQAFKPILIEGNAIQVHPLVCTAFNADFDGDQMAVHVPLSADAQLEAREIMASDKNILKPGDGEPTISSKLLDIVLGCYWMTKLVPGEQGEGKYFSSPNAAITAYDFDLVGFRTKIKVLASKKAKYGEFAGMPFETSVGRLLFNSVLPDDYPFVNKEIDKKAMTKIIDDLIIAHGPIAIGPIMDKIKSFGFKYGTHSGITWGIDDVTVPDGKKSIIDAARKKSVSITNEFNEGLLSEEERVRLNIELWQAARMEIEKILPATLDPKASVYDMLKSGARGSTAQLVQMAGMKGLIQNVLGETIEHPVVSSYKEGLTPIEYFITTNGSRKGLTDTALNTAKAGYLTRRMFDVAQDIIVTESDCGGKDGIVISRASTLETGSSVAKKIRGRTLAEDVKSSDGAVLFKKGSLLTKDDAQKVDAALIETVIVRSPLSCKTLHGICAKCYGMDLGKGALIDIGEAVGTIAAQAIGEPGTQLTMRTFHAGGVAGADITAGLPRVEEIFEKRRPKNPAVVSAVSGTVASVKDFGTEKVITIIPELEDKGKSKKSGEVEYKFNPKRVALVRQGDRVKKGDILTDGSADIDEIFEYAGRERAMEYIIGEVSKPYELQGAAVDRKHIEIIVKQMFAKKTVTDPGSSSYCKGDVIDELDFVLENRKIKEGKGEALAAESVVMGITESSLSRRSFLAAASFQHTKRILINAAVKGTEDTLEGLKENVIIGRVIPAGTGFAGSEKHGMIEKLHKASEQSVAGE
ncbi:MAG: DNA-directed RNA polymerase subunit beta' [Patescibacteria group bacterium]|nr:DNA-directed RNA polymerase subunit beta' [Patescibacteria group bacterium]MDE1945876.1 DNA-directed RNA polymerase subunit beta' [Patescibacteria group bacterium]